MITLTVNGEEKSLAEHTTVAAALKLWGYQCEEIAVAINSEFVPRTQYAVCTFAASDFVDIVAPVQGG